MNITPEIALQIIDAATSPANAGRMTRQDYANVEAALKVLAEFVKEKSALADEKKE